MKAMVSHDVSATLGKLAVIWLYNTIHTDLTQLVREGIMQCIITFT